MREATVTRNTLSEATKGNTLERAIVQALLEVTHDLRLTVGRNEIWPMVYARVPCTEAEFWSTMDAVVRVLTRERVQRSCKRPRLSLVK
jgi:hypothetical protein